MPHAERRLRIAVDARELLVAQRTGVERVAYHFIDELAAFQDWEVVLLFDAAPPAGLRCCAVHETVVEAARYPVLQKALDAWAVLQLPRVLREHRIDAYISINTKIPVFSRVPAFATVHGVEWYFYPQCYRMVERVKQRLWLELATRCATGIVTFAENTRRDIARIRPSSAVPLCTVAEGCDAMFRRLASQEVDAALPARLGMSAPYILSVCSHVPRKNIDGLLQAYARLAPELPHGLVLVGKAGWKAQALRELARALGIADRVTFAGYVSDNDLVQLYNAAALFVYPSRYEGFGLPLLEAMACGVPVVTANRSATAEVARGAAVLVDPDSVADMAEGMRRALTDEALRATLVSAGYRRAGEHSWAAMAGRIHDFVQERVALAATVPRAATVGT